MRKRIDTILFELGLAESRTQAQQLIKSGAISVKLNNDFQLVTKPSESFSDLTLNQIQKKTSEIEKYVSRGGIKLEGALLETQITIHEKLCLDIGQSTGGFTDCLIKFGAKLVVGIDVGHDQLHAKLREDPKVITIEGLNLKNARPALMPYLNQSKGFDVIVVDVSFISVTHVFPIIFDLLNSSGTALCLIKPQFEVGSNNLNKKGVVKNQDLYRSVQEKIEQACWQSKLDIVKYFRSPIEGKDGNIEFFAQIKKV